MQLARGCIAAGLAMSALAAQAQSNGIQVYGIADAGVEYVNKVRTGAVGSPTASVTRLQSGSAQSSRLGFRGREDLGGGLTALFALEGGISLDTGTLGQGGRLFGRHAYVGLNDKALGEMQLGREATVIYDFGVAFDPQTATRYSSTVFDAAYAGRADNAVKYVGKFGGLKLGAQYSLGFDGLIANGGELPSNAFRVGKEMGFSAGYELGNLAFSAAYDRQNGTSVATQFNKTERSVIGAAYRLKPATLFAAYQRQTLKTPVSSVETKLFWAGLRYDVSGALSLSSALYFNDPDGGSNRSTMLSLMGSYALSKRTDIYSQLAFMKNQDAATAGMGGAVNPGDNQTGLIVGIRHRF